VCTVHRLTYADHVVVIGANTVAEEGTFTKLSAQPGAIQDLLALAGPTAVREMQPTLDQSAKPRVDDVQSSYIGSLTEPIDDIEAEMAATRAHKNIFFVYLSGGGKLVACLSLTLQAIMSVIPSIIPVYVQAWTSALQKSRDNLLSYMGG
jgi:ATP-binding cassette subfamily C (CFTR/MRP) protein 1